METKRERAIKIIEECRDIHRRWMQWQNETRTGKWQKEVDPEDVGMPDEHLRWVEKYEEVLEVLRDI